MSFGSSCRAASNARLAAPPGLLATWKAEGLLRRDERPTVHLRAAVHLGGAVYAHTFAAVRLRALRQAVAPRTDAVATRRIAARALQATEPALHQSSGSTDDPEGAAEGGAGGPRPRAAINVSTADGASAPALGDRQSGPGRPPDPAAAGQADDAHRLRCWECECGATQQLSQWPSSRARGRIRKRPPGAATTVWSTIQAGVPRRPRPPSTSPAAPRRATAEAIKARLTHERGEQQTRQQGRVGRSSPARRPPPGSRSSRSSTLGAGHHQLRKLGVTVCRGNPGRFLGVDAAALASQRT